MKTGLEYEVEGLDGVERVRCEGHEIPGMRGRMTTLPLNSGERVFGLGETAGPHDKRGPRFQGSSHVLWNSDHFAWDPGTDPLYASVPFLLFLREGECRGVFFDNPGRLHFDIGHSDPSVVRVTARTGSLDHFTIDGPKPAEVLRRYTDITGKPFLPPRWALGLHQCRYSYETAERALHVAKGFRIRDLPGDAIWLDIHHLLGFRPLTWDPEAFPEPEAMVEELRALGFRTVVIVDPHLAADDNDPRYPQAIDADVLMKRPDGSVYEGPVWPSKAPEGAVDSVFFDFTRRDARELWGRFHDALVSVGVGGVWNDMNEPTVFEGLEGTFPADLHHRPDGVDHPVAHEALHNAYGMLMTRATFEGLAKLREGERPFVFTRSTWAGGQQFAAVWTGDAPSDWEALSQSMRTLLGMSVSGLNMVGTDLGGFSGDTEPELFWRWLQAHVLTPVFRIHTDIQTADQEPWSFGTRWTEKNRRVLELRYQFLPELERVMREAHETGVPSLRPMWFEYPEVGELWSVDDCYFCGSRVLVAPIWLPGQASRSLRLPPGQWLSWPDRRVCEGEVSVDGAQSGPGVFLKADAFIVMQDPVLHVDESPSAGRTVVVLPSGATVQDSWIEDDGLSPESQRATRTLSIEGADDSRSLIIGAREGGLELPTRPLRVIVADGARIRRSEADRWSESVEIEDDGSSLRLSLRIGEG